MKHGAQDRKLLESVERGEWRSAAGGMCEQARFFTVRQGYDSQGPEAERVRPRERGLTTGRLRRVQGHPFSWRHSH